MKTQVIPAQITTVEDKIAGNFNLTQILLLMLPVFWTTIVYTLLSPRLQFSWYKLPMILIVFVLCVALSLRIKGKVLLHWLIIIFRYNLRPKYYVFNKNESFLRTLNLPVFEKKGKVLPDKAAVKKEAKRETPGFSVRGLVRLENLIANPKYSFSLKSGKKGSLYVAIEQNRK